MLTKWQMVTSERGLRITTRSLMAIGLLWLAIVIYVPPYLASRIDTAALCRSLDGCETLSIEPVYLPGRKRLAWGARLVTTRPANAEMVQQRVLARIRDSFALSVFSQDVTVSMERQNAPRRG